MTEVAPSGHYARRQRLTTPPCPRRQSLRQLVRNCYFENRRRYGSRRIQKALGETGINIGRRTVRCLMTEENLTAIRAKAFKPKTTDSKGVSPAANLLAEIKSEECAAAKIIIGDITYIRLRGGRFAYLAIWQDKIARRIIGWSLGLEMSAELAVSAFQKAIGKGAGQSRSDCAFRPRKPIYLKWISPPFAAQRISAKYERARQLLRDRSSRKFFLTL